MLTIVITQEGFDEEEGLFVKIPVGELHLEHSLASLSKWEQKWKKPFLDKSEKTAEETLDYIRCMSVNPFTPPELFEKLSEENADQIRDYIQDSHTATWFNDKNSKPSTRVITSELVYYWMVAHNIDWDAQYWHLNRLITLVRVCNEMNSQAHSGNKPQRMSREALNERSQENARRRAMLNSRG